MTTATLSDIITKVRKLTGTGNSLQLTDANIIDYINSFYLYDFPSEFRSLQLKNTVTINTIQNVDTYAFDYDHYETVESPVFIDKRLTPLYTSPWPFYSLFFNWQIQELLDTGDGTTGAYAGTVQDFPVIKSVNNNPAAQTLEPSSSTFPASFPPAFTEPNPQRVQNILITANSGTTTLNVTDDGAGNLIGDASAGTIAYATGAITGLVFTSAIDSGNDINISYKPANPNRPQAVLFWQNQITVRPVPDKGYTIELVAYRRPSEALLGTTNPDAPTLTGRPELLCWWETLASGAAKKIFEDRQDMDGVMMMDKMLQERYTANEARTYAQLGSQTMATIYNTQNMGAYQSWGSNSG